MFSFELLLDAVVLGVLLGCFYAAVSIGLSVSFGLLDVPHVAHPAIMVFGSYCTYLLCGLGLDPIVAGIVLMPPFNYAIGQMLEQAVNGTKSLDQKQLAAYLRKNEMKTIVGSIRFDKSGEWANPRVVQAQFRGVVDKDVEQFRQPGKQVVIYPDDYKTGEVIAPFEKARQAKA